jgi:hypothetical protein
MEIKLGRNLFGDNVYSSETRYTFQLILTFSLFSPQNGKSSYSYETTVNNTQLYVCVYVYITIFSVSDRRFEVNNAQK